MHGEVIGFELGVAYGHVRTWIETFSQETGIPYEVLASRVSELLYDTRGEQIAHRVSTMSRKTTSRNTAVAEVAVAKRSPGDKTQGNKRKGHRRNTYWERMTAAQRKEEMARRFKRRLKPGAAA